MSSNNDSMDPRESVLLARDTMIAESSIGVTLLVTLALLESKALKEKYPTMRFWNKRTDRTILWMFGLTLFGLAFQIDSLLMNALDWTNNEAGCRTAASPFSPLLFVITKQFLYYFLYERSCIVHDSLKLKKHQFFARFRLLVAMAIVVFVP